MKLVLFAALATLGTLGTACSSKAPEERKDTVASAPDESRKAEPARPAAAPRAAVPAAHPATGATPADFPKECAGYAALIDRLKTCDQAGGARAGLIQAYESLRSSWMTVPADRRDEVARQCNTQAESLRNAVAATCGW